MMQSVGSQASPGWSQLSPVVSFFDHILDDAMHLGVVLIRRCLIEWPRLLPPACSGNLRSPFVSLSFESVDTRAREHRAIETFFCVSLPLLAAWHGRAD